MDRHRRFGRLSAVVGMAAVLLAPPLHAQWVTYVDETATRLAGVAPALGSGDAEEKDYAWGDFDHDGDFDLAVARKQPFTSPGKRTAVLMMNVNGVLTDRTADFATVSTVTGDQGFLTPTNTRDIVAVDVDLDGWLDLVTGPAISPADPKHIGHPRVYRNRGCQGNCNGNNWLGFRFENNRIPTMLSAAGQPGNPCLCGVAAGDVTGDGYPELWLIDYDTGEGCSGSTDFNNRLLVNGGASAPGMFTDVTQSAFFGSATDGYFPNSAFGASGKILDLNGDGKNDLVKQYAGHVGVAFNENPNPGTFDTYSNPFGGGTYFMNTANLNNDDRPDLIISDDGADRYLINQGNGSDSVADFLSFTYSFLNTGGGPAASDDGFGGTNIAADLNHDNWQDVIITDNDVDISGCSRRTHIYKNLGGTPGGQVTLQEQVSGTGCNIPGLNPATCLVTGIPANKLTGVFDVATFDINGDQWLDLVVGRCSGTQVYINQPPVLPAGSLDPDDANAMLLLGRGPTGRIELNWGDSCQAMDTAFNVYRGTLGNFTTHVSVECGVPAHTLSVDPVLDNTYYLVVPTNGTWEGSYGTASNGTARPPATDACEPQVVGACN